jgi:hypothetical protein
MLKRRGVDNKQFDVNASSTGGGEYCQGHYVKKYWRFGGIHREIVKTPLGLIIT